MKTRKWSKILLQRQSIRPTEKGQFGEVFTPVAIIDEMLASLPSSVWSNPNLRWLDPACGLGNFPMRIIHGGQGYPGLYEGLRDVLPKDDDRRTHIVSMITCYDINVESVKTFRGLLKQFSTGEATNVHVGDFLEADDSSLYDIVVGNPPYNSGGTKRLGEKRLHIRFAERALSMLRKEGYLLFVCPPNYRQAGSVMNKLFLEKGAFSYLRILGPEETHKVFGIQSRVDVFLFHVGGGKSRTRLIDEYGVSQSVHLDLSRHVPNFGHSIFEKLREGPRAEVTAFRTAEASTVGCKGFGRSGFPTVHLLVSGGRKLLRRRVAHTLQDVPKLLVNGLGVPYVLYDGAGVYGVTQVPLVVVRPSADLVAFAGSPLFFFLVWALRLTGNNNLPYLFDDVPADFGRGLRLTAEERALVDSFVVPMCADRDIWISCDMSKTRKK